MTKMKIAPISDNRDLTYILLSQILGCFLVILGHSYPFITDMPYYVDLSRGYIYTFHMPLFVWCSGFLFAYTRQADRKTFFTYVSQRARKLLIPYFVLSLIGIFPKYFFSSLLNDSLALDTESIVRAFLVPRENIWGHFWFLPMIFFLGCISLLIDKLITRTGFSRKSVWMIVFAIFLALEFCADTSKYLLWLGVNDILRFGWSFALGVLVYLLFGDFQGKLKSDGCQCCIVGGGIFVFTLAVYYSYIDIDGIYKRVLYMMIAVLMIYALLMLCAKWSESTNINRKSTVAQTYQIFILSWPCQLVVGIIIERILHLQWWVFIPFVFISGVFGPIIIIKIVDWFENKTKTKILSYILGK